MTKADFLAFYPHFSGLPDVVVDTLIADANRRFGHLLDAQEEARRLYVAHKLTLYARSIPQSSDASVPVTVGQIASSGSAMQATSKSVGGVSVSFSEGSGVSSIKGFGEWKTTSYGLELIALCKASFGMEYVS